MAAIAVPALIGFVAAAIGYNGYNGWNNPAQTIYSQINPLENYLINRTEFFYNNLHDWNATTLMTTLAPYSSALTGVSGINDSAFNNINPAAMQSRECAGAAQVLQLAVFQDQTQFLEEAVKYVELDVYTRITQFRTWAMTNNPDGDVKQRQERGDIAWEAWLLNQADSYFSAPAGEAQPNTTQGLMEQFTRDYVENLCNVTTWPTTGYNKEVAQGLHAAAMLGVYGEARFKALYPCTYTGFFLFWDRMFMGADGSYEPDNSIGYISFNVGMVFNMALWMNRVTRSAQNKTDPHAYLSDSVDLKRVMDNVAAEMMSNGDAVNYNRGMPHYEVVARQSPAYAWNSPGTGTPFILYMGYMLYNDNKYLYTARKIERFLVTVGSLPQTLLTQVETYPPNIKHFDKLDIPPPAVVSELTYQRVSPGCYNNLLLCRGATQNLTMLIPNKMVLRAGSTPGSDNNAYVLLSVSGGGQHANTDQRMTLENTMYNGSYITARAGTTVLNPYGVDQVNLCNCILVMPNNSSYPLINETVNFYTKVGMDPTQNNYVLQSASTAQSPDGSAYGQLVFEQYQYAGIRASRQVVLTTAGVIVVVDQVYSASGNSASGNSVSGNSATLYNGGITYRLWPNVTASGTNWALQTPFFGMNNTSHLPSTTNTSTLLWINTSNNRTIGMRSEPMTDFTDGSGSETVTTLYAYDLISPNVFHTFVTVLYPLSNVSTVTEIVDSIVVHGTTVSIPTLDGSANKIITFPHLNLVPITKGNPIVSLDASTLNLTTGQPVTVWYDQIHHYAFTPSNKKLSPTMNLTAMNGSPAVYFNGSQSLTGPNIFPMFSDYTVVMEVMLTNYTSGNMVLLGSAVCAQHVMFHNRGHVRVVHNTVSSYTNVTHPAILNTSTVVTFVWKQSLGLGTLYMNNTTISTFAVAPSTTVGDSTMILGYTNSAGYDHLQGYVSKLQVYNYAFANTVLPSLITYPDPPLEKSNVFTVVANNVSLFVWNADGYSGVNFAMNGTVDVVVTFSNTISVWEINPHSYNLVGKLINNTSLEISLVQPAKFEVVINNGTAAYQTNQTLYVFADAPEVDVPEANDDTVYYIKSGEVYSPTSPWMISSNETRRGIYLAPGSRLNAALAINTAHPFKVWGRGFVYNPFQNKTATNYGPYSVALCAMNVHLQDFVHFGAQNHIVTISYCYGPINYNITIDNIKLLTTAAETDAFRICGSVNNVVINNSFIVNNDDMVVIGQCSGDTPEIGPYNNTVTRSTFIKLGRAGGWYRLDTATTKMGGGLGPNNVINNCDVVRLHNERLIYQTSVVINMSEIVFNNIRVQSPRVFDILEPNLSSCCGRQIHTIKHAIARGIVSQHNSWWRIQRDI